VICVIVHGNPVARSVKSTTTNPFISTCELRFSLLSYVEEDGVVFMEAANSISGRGSVTHRECSLRHRTGARNSAGTSSPAPSTSGACNDLNSFAAAVVDSGSRSHIQTYHVARSTTPTPTAKVLK
jgi:hypothetical protein